MLFYTRTSPSQSLEKKEFSRNLGTSPAVKYSTHYSSQLLVPLPGCCPSTWSHLCPATCWGEGQNSTFVLFLLAWDINYQELGKLVSAARAAVCSLLHIVSLPHSPEGLGDANLGSDPRPWGRGENPLQALMQDLGFVGSSGCLVFFFPASHRGYLCAAYLQLSGF